MKFLLRTLVSLTLLLLSFKLTNWIIYKFYQWSFDWPIFWYVVSCLLFIIILRVLIGFLAVIIASMMFTYMHPITSQWKKAKNSLYVIGWIMCAICIYVNLSSLELGLTKHFAIAIIIIAANAFIPWEVDKRVFIEERKNREMENVLSHILKKQKAAHELARLINEGKITYQDALHDIRLMKDKGVIDDLDAVSILEQMREKLQK